MYSVEAFRRLQSVLCMTCLLQTAHKIGVNNANLSLNVSQVRLNSTEVGLNSAQFSLFTVSYRCWKWKCGI